MEEATLQLIYVIVFFVYGLAFFGMGIAMALETGRSPVLVETRVLRPLAAFGLLHGSHEWLESYLMQADWLGTSLPLWLLWLRLSLLITSFIFLFIFAFNLLKISSNESKAEKSIRHAILLGYVTAICLFAYLAYPDETASAYSLLDAYSRYLLAVPASLLAAIALQARSRQARSEGLHELKSYFSIAALGFLIYALTQLFVQPLKMFPASIINQANFIAAAGFPIQAIRTLIAVAIAIGLLRGAQQMEIERNTQFLTVQRGRLEALQQREMLRRNLLRRCVRAQEEERARVASELHDETAQSLSAFSLELATLRSMLRKQKSTTEKVDHLLELSRQISQGLYRLMSNLRPAQLDDLGLVPAIQFILDQECNTRGMDLAFHTSGKVHRLDPLLETVLFRVAQEALHNIILHAETRHGEFTLSFENEAVELQILDRGQGFDANASFIAPRGWGLAGMRERVESVGGEFILLSAAGQGTTIKAVIPLVGMEGGVNGNHNLNAG